MLKKVSFNFKGKNISIEARECKGLNKFFGLMFKNKEKTNALIFEFKKPVSFRIHSFFVFFSFIAVWIDESNKIIEIRRVKPFTFSIKTKKYYKRLLEIPLNKKYMKKVQHIFL